MQSLVQQPVRYFSVALETSQNVAPSVMVPLDVGFVKLHPALAIV
jgi:hypothetical protein